MLSNLIISSQRLVLVIDELGQEKNAQKFLCQLLREQGQDKLTTKTLTLSSALKEQRIYEEFLKECTVASEGGQKWNVVLPTLADLLCYQRPAIIFQFLNNLRKCTQVKRTFIWASMHHLMHPQAPFVVAACEHMSDLVLRFETSKELTIITRKPGGGVTNKRYTCKKSKNEFIVEPAKSNRKSQSPEENTAPTVEQLGTFKIELDEEELVARNALKLPYEKTSEPTEGNIIYTPDADDDFDDEDPDEDLCI